MSDMQAVAFMIARGRMPNQERLDNPLTADQAWLLLRGATSLDFQRLAAHRLFDMAIQAGDIEALDVLIKTLTTELNPVFCTGLLKRVADQCLLKDWQTWAQGIQRPQALVA